MNMDIGRLPPAVRDLAHGLGARGGEGGSVQLSQIGRMRQDESVPWMKFRARQIISTTSCAFEWRARTGPAGMVTVRDALVAGEGALDVRALGVIPIAHLASTPAITRGELMRYLAELALAPDIILCNAELAWRSDGPVRCQRGRRRCRGGGHAWHRRRWAHRNGVRRGQTAHTEGRHCADAVARPVQGLSPASRVLASVRRRCQLDHRWERGRVLGRTNADVEPKS